MTTQTRSPVTLGRSFSWTFAGNLLYATCQWGMLIVMAKLNTPEMVGRFTLGLAVTAPVFMFTNLCLRSVQATDTRQLFRFGDYLGLRILSIGTALAVIGLIAFLAGYHLPVLLVVLSLGIAKALESTSDLCYGLLQHHERMEFIAKSLMLKGVLSVVLFGIGVYCTGEIFWGVLGLIVAQGLVLFLFDLANVRRVARDNSERQPESTSVRPYWDWLRLKQLLRLSLPLGIVMMLISVSENTPRYFVERYLGERELGIFGALAYLMIAGVMLINALGEAAVPKLARFYAARDEKAFRTLVLKLMGLGAMLGLVAVLGAWCFGRQVLSLLYSPEYGEYSGILVWLAVAAAITFSQAFVGYALGAARYFRSQVPVFLMVSFSILLACVAWIPAHGLKGAALAVIVGAVVRTILTLGVLCHALAAIHKPDWALPLNEVA